MSIDPRLEIGVQLFNQQAYFEAHEALEKVWLETTDEEIKSFLKGLIQAAVALHHLQHDNQNGARKVCQTAIQYLEPYQPQHLGLNVRSLMSSLSTYVGIDAPKEKGAHQPTDVPLPKMSAS
ncbi:MAG: hypothetical protein COV74_04760 [Candidatus Omnitrophica bacterium CG11_big_fil_rev_8_21_14_0_20_45_26]|uniref:DUF309 domain-containing protein n=1 Tax=Candidatus Abzuiibacterium crystallinum TaxID=1974748 RepID=A0A2H0LQ61_9BACT|nr:MAG: hypothetical protein COV74_04760 [Candidatus Omnitrophica bacterium CG11_big_fil_rev_8_21_14_0_20_45_26]PIW64193.1 MAG: hypothetical protein COW12_07275 [Candidatus Omnitrophica bacterium CG12_big_fil_rev_8_21_14_0_65_45_16]